MSIHSDNSDLVAYALKKSNGDYIYWNVNQEEYSSRNGLSPRCLMTERAACKARLSLSNDYYADFYCFEIVRVHCNIESCSTIGIQIDE